MGVKGVLAWRVKAEKINALIIRSILQSLTSYLLKMHGDPAVANQELKKIGRDMGEFIYTRFLAATQRPAKRLEELADTKSAYNLGFKFFTGTTFDKTEFKRESSDVYITYTIEDCPLCKDLVSPSPQMFLCTELAGILEWIEENRLQDWKAESVTCDEVLCRARGDPVCKFVFHFHLKEPELY